MAERCHGAPVREGRRGPDGRERTLRVALAGNPNVGKSSLFNRLTGAQQHVANWPGKTVERRSGTCRLGDRLIEVVDLPGTYSLAAGSPEEVVAERALVDGDVDVVAVVLDSANLERNLYLAAQIAELGCPLVLVLNMVDAARRDGLRIDDTRLAEAFDAPVVRTVARTGEGLEHLVRALVHAGTRRPLRIDYGDVVETGIRSLDPVLAVGTALDGSQRRWLALRLLEQEPTTVADVAVSAGGARVLAAADRAAERIRDRIGVDAGLLFADRRYAWAHGLAAEVVDRSGAPRSRTDRLDDVLLHPWLGIPIFLAVMWWVFTAVVAVADPFVGWIEAAVDGPVSRWTEAAAWSVGLDGTWLESLLVDGALTGVGAVLVFLPVLAILYGVLGLLEDSGYMARVAYLMDRVMAPLGLSGKSFLPLLLGFGCNVPAVYATRVLDRRRERIITALLVPFVSCAARLPVYVLLASVFFPGYRGTVVFGVYVLSIVMVVALGAVLDRLLLRDERPGSFVLELPAYRRPTRRVLGGYIGQRVGAFVRNAGTVILAASLVVWLLLAMPAAGGGFGDSDLEDSAFAATSRIIAPVLAPAGFGSWEMTGTLLSGMVAKEVMLATLWQVSGTSDGGVEDRAPAGGALDDLRELGGGLVTAVRDAALAIPATIGIDVRADAPQDTTSLAEPLRASLDTTSGGRGALAAVALLAFVLLYVPCVATAAAIRHELGGRWALVSAATSLTVAWITATAIFQVGSLLGRALGILAGGG